MPYYTTQTFRDQLARRALARGFNDSAYRGSGVGSELRARRFAASGSPAQVVAATLAGDRAREFAQIQAQRVQQTQAQGFNQRPDPAGVNRGLQLGGDRAQELAAIPPLNPYSTYQQPLQATPTPQTYLDSLVERTAGIPLISATSFAGTKLTAGQVLAKQVRSLNEAQRNSPEVLAHLALIEEEARRNGEIV